ncbi:MAG: DUF3830 family protein [Rubrivivax sp.]
MSRGAGPHVLVQVGRHEPLLCRLETAAAPATCHWFRSMLPYQGALIHARWSGHAVFARIGALACELPEETPLSEPAAGQVVVYRSSAAAGDGEILFAYGPTRFANPSGPLRGNLLMTVLGAADGLKELGRAIHVGGSLPARFGLAP